MPTFNIRKVRRLLRTGRARIAGHKPFVVQLLYETTDGIQDIEITEDTGYLYVGLSVKSEKHEYASEERKLLDDEKVRHDNRRKYRRARRNRLRYRKPRFSNRKASKKTDRIAPSLLNKADRQIDMVIRYARICPVTSIVIEAGQFDTQALKAMEKGEPLPQGVDYQCGPSFEYDNLREAVFARDGYKCLCCGKSSIEDGKILRMHHLGYRKNDRSNRMDNLATVCTDCHTPANHKKGGVLYGLKPKLKPSSGAAFMNTVKWYIYRRLQEKYPDMVHLTYGSVTKRERNRRNIAKTHANDAYCIGGFHPKHRTCTGYYKKVRRHNRILSKFYDSRWVDRRDGKIRSGAQLANGRTCRNHKRDTENLRVYRKKRIRKGRYVLRAIRYSLQPGDTVSYKGADYTVVGMKNNGAAVTIQNQGGKCNPSVRSVRLMERTGGWSPVLKPA